MKYIKTFEDVLYPYQWKNIVRNGNELYVHLYELAAEMEEKIFREGRDKYEYDRMGKYYINLVRDLLEGKVITYHSDEEDETVTGICESVNFESAFGLTQEGDDEDRFQFDYILLKLEEKNYEENLSDDNDEIVVHLDEDTNLWREMGKYNL